jgi:hypothetical protein
MAHAHSAPLVRRLARAGGESHLRRHRLVVGACLDRGPVVAIWLTETLRAPNTRSLTVLQASDALYLDRASWNDDTVRALEADVARGGCREVPGTDQMIL